MDTPNDDQWTISFEEEKGDPPDRITPVGEPPDPETLERMFDELQALQEAYRSEPLVHGRAFAEHHIRDAWSPRFTLRRQRLNRLFDAADILRRTAPLDPASEYWRVRLAQVQCMYVEEILDADYYQPEDMVYLQEAAAEAVREYETLASDALRGCRHHAWMMVEGLAYSLGLLETMASRAGVRVPGVPHPRSRLTHIALTLKDLRDKHPCSCGQCSVEQ